MLKKALIIGGLLSLAAHHLHAQSPADQKSPVGVWEGKYTSNHGPAGTLKITIAHDSVVSAVMEFNSSVQVPPSAFKSITHAEGRVTWTQDLMGTACDGTGTFPADDKFKGEIKCGPAVINFEVKKKA